MRPDHQTAIVVLTHDDKFDEPALIGALETDAFYIGALGSRRNQERRRERLLEAGVPEEALDRISGPCGLDIGADTQEETALSIMSEILAVRARARGRLPAGRQEAHSRRGRIAIARVAWLSLAPVKSTAADVGRRDRARAHRHPWRPPLLPDRRRGRAPQREARAVAAGRSGRVGRRAPAAALSRRPRRSTGDVELGERLVTSFFGRPVEGRLVEGPWNDALTAYVGRPLRLARTEREGDGVDRGRLAGATLVSTGVARRAASRRGRRISPSTGAAFA